MTATWGPFERWLSIISTTDQHVGGAEEVVTREDEVQSTKGQNGKKEEQERIEGGGEVGRRDSRG